MLIPDLSLKMKWHNTLTVCCIIGGLFNIGNGANYLLGTVYNNSAEGVTAEMVYDYFGSALKIADVIYGCVGIIAGVLLFFLFSGMKNLRQKALNQYWATILFVSLSGVVYNIATSFILQTFSVSIGTNVGTIIGLVVYLSLNYTYYKKRYHLFVN